MGDPVNKQLLPTTALRERLADARKAAHSEHRGEEPAGRVRSWFQTLLWVAPLTILIWIYAERAQRATLDNLTVSFTLVSSDPQRIITVLTPQDRQIVLSVEGPRAGLDAIRAGIARQSQPLEISVPARDDPPFEGQIPMAQLLSESDFFLREAVTVKSAHPAVVARIEKKAMERVPVKLKPDQKLIGTVTFSPDYVVMEGPKTILGNLPSLAAYADLSSYANMKPGKYEEAAVPLTFSEQAPGITFRPETVKATIEIKPSEPATLNFIPVFALVPGSTLGEDRVKLELSPVTLTRVRISGPPDEVQKVVEGRFAAAVVVPIRPEHLSGKEPEYTLKAEDYRLPKDVTVEDPGRVITIRVAER